MIDIKAIREAAEKAQKFHFNRLRFADFTRQANPATVLALCDEIERLRKDATRYQWIASYPYHDGYAWWTQDVCIVESDDSNVTPTKSQVDASIDAAMESVRIDYRARRAMSKVVYSSAKTQQITRAAQKLPDVAVMAGRKHASGTTGEKE